MVSVNPRRADDLHERLAREIARAEEAVARSKELRDAIARRHRERVTTVSRAEEIRRRRPAT
jgi:hypothetical protein